MRDNTLLKILLESGKLNAGSFSTLFQRNRVDGSGVCRLCSNRHRWDGRVPCATARNQLALPVQRKATTPADSVEEVTILVR